jgi:CheY-like chemotaxis protein
VYGVVQQHGGSIVVGDGAPHGARFVISLPGVAAGAPSPARRAPAPELRHGTGRVLVVEDDEQVRRATRTLLEMLGYDVVEASDGLDALDVFRSHAPTIDAVLLDVVMPRQSGRATLPALRAIREVPVVVTTGSATGDEHAEWRALGAHALLAKPYDLGELSNVLADAIG